MTRFDEAHYRWYDEPDDGEYEIQFDRFESNKAVFLIVDQEIDDIIGQAVFHVENVPDLNSGDSITTRIFHGMVKDREVIDMTYDSELSEQRHEKTQQQLDDLFQDNESETGH
ncbi:hypothetical protein [Halocatena pleomorpha]|uniref:DUF3006 domain-containing protein n=1 Tax=Halocatena pleomorpha TaxID=1785090 RepID=A0A3P3R4K0_9EURY|nr:hypothetical protein [Halocatena pleomorpha]RRJ27580.1 hypothetical protein EIK79_17580 [Halocatena pleomorpha]